MNRSILIIAILLALCGCNSQDPASYPQTEEQIVVTDGKDLDSAIEVRLGSPLNLNQYEPDTTDAYWQITDQDLNGEITENSFIAYEEAIFQLQLIDRDEIVANLTIAAKQYLHDSELRLNQIQVLGTHNSYHRAGPLAYLIKDWRYTHEPLDTQLDMGVRQFELDLHYGLFGLEVYHVPVVDGLTTAKYFEDQLETLYNWSLNNPGHLPIMVIMELKDELDIIKFSGRINKVDEEILNIWPRERIITPDDVRGEYATLPAAIQSAGWPSLSFCRDKIMFMLHNGGDYRDEYFAEGQNKIMFADAAFDHPYGGWKTLNTPGDDVKEQVENGLLVRTRADAECEQAINEDYTTQEAAWACGAQMVSTDFPAPPSYSNYFCQVPGGAPARPNPVTTVEGEYDALDIENLGY